MRDSSHQYAANPRSSEELAALLRQETASEEARHEAKAILQFRGGVQELEIGRRLTQSEDPEDRATGAEILGQLGWQDRTFIAETVDVLIHLLKDPDLDVVYCAAVGLGHRCDSRAISPLIPLAEHEDSHVRFGVALGLSGHNDERAVSTLIRLCQDPDEDTRNWAMFGLGSQTDLDSPFVREALLRGVADPNPEIRGEALIGLARRGEQRVIELIRRELMGEFHGMWPVEAAELIGSPELLELLVEQRSRLSSAEPAYFFEEFDRAIAACRKAASK